MRILIGKKVKIGSGVRNTATTIKFGRYGLSNPSNITGMVGWFDMQDSSSFVHSGSTMTSITNKISSVVWSTAESVKPSYNSVGINNHPTMDFNGSTQGLSSASETTMNTLFAANNAFTVFYVAKHNTLGVAEDVFSSARNATSGFKGFGQDPTSVWRFDNQTTAGTVITAKSTGASNTNINIFEFYSSGSNASIQVNGASADPNAVSWVIGNNLATTILGIGLRARSLKDAHFNGSLGELLIYNWNMGAGHRLDIRTYLSNKWGVAI